MDPDYGAYSEATGALPAIVTVLESSGFDAITVARLFGLAATALAPNAVAQSDGYCRARLFPEGGATHAVRVVRVEYGWRGFIIYSSFWKG